MKYRSTVCGLLAVCAAACLHPPIPTLVPVGRIAVFPPNNRTGDPLLIAGASFLEKYVLPSDRFTVPDALAAGARVQLARAGFDVVRPDLVDRAASGHTISSAQEAATVAAHQQLDGAVLFIDIRRWEADAAYHPTFVIVSVSATLVDPPTGRVLWTADRPSRPVQTPGVINVGDAYAIAARVVMEELLAGLGPQRPTA